MASLLEKTTLPPFCPNSSHLTSVKHTQEYPFLSLSFSYLLSSSPFFISMIYIEFIDILQDMSKVGLIPFMVAVKGSTPKDILLGSLCKLSQKYTH